MRLQLLQHKRRAAGNIVLAIVGLTVVKSTFVLLLGICANGGLTFFKCPTIAKPQNVINNHTDRTKTEPSIINRYAVKGTNFEESGHGRHV